MHYYTHEELDGATRASLNGFARTIKLHGRSKMKVNELRDALRKRLPPREGTSPGLFVELCAGTAALSLRLHKEGAKPPVSRMGSKTGYANTILHELGLYPGLKASRYLWCEPDDGCRLLLETYRDHDLATATAEIILGWKDEDPKSLWTRLRKEGPVVAPTPREAARWTLALPGGAWTTMPPRAIYCGPGHGRNRWGCLPVPTVADRYEDLDELPAEITDGAVDPREVARWTLALPGGAWTAMPPKAMYRGPGCYLPARPKDAHLPHPIPNVAARYENLDTIPGEITDGAVDPREVARWTHLVAAGAGMLGSYFNPEHSDGGWVTAPPETTARRVEDLPTIPGEITDGAVEPPLLPPNTVVYIDPPYVNTTGYRHNLGRDRVVELALAWHAAGATVCISEQEAIPELVAQGWRSVDITGKRQGQKRTFSKQKSEYLTISPETPC